MIGSSPSKEGGKFAEFLSPISNQAQSVVDDVTRIKTHPLVPAYIPIHCYIYDVETGRLLEVPEATRAGAVSAAATV